MSASSWRLAARLARREVRRRPGRTALVVLLVAVPVLGMTVAGVLARSLVSQDHFVTEHPAGVDLEVEGAPADVVRRLLPDGADVWEVGTIGAPIQAADGTTTEWVEIVELRDGREHVRSRRAEGELPGPGEVWLTRNLLDELGVDLGDELELAYPPGTWRVVGTGERSAGLRSMVVAELDHDAFVSSVQPLTVVDLPGDPTDEELRAASNAISGALGVTPWSRVPDADADDEGDRDAVVLWSWLAGSVGLSVLGIVIAAAFATSARRQLVTIGLLSANGAPERTIGRALTLQGTWSGLAGSLLGIAGGWVALQAAVSWSDGLAAELDGGWSLRPLDLVVIAAIGTLASTAAARVPSRTAARVPVMAALAGRRPLAEVPPSLVRLGLVAFGLGVVLLAAATSSLASGGDGEGAALTAVIGGVVLLGGICCCTPLVTDLASRAGARLGGSWRLAGRSLGRTRARTAAVVTAIAATAAVALAVSVGLPQIAGASEGADRPRDLVEVVPGAMIPVEEWVGGTAGALWGAPQVAQQVDGDLRAAVEAAVPGARWIPRQVVALDVPEQPGGGELDAWAYDDLLVATPEVLDAYRVSDENRRRLREAGILSLWSFPEPAPRVLVTGGRRVPIEPASAEIDEDDLVPGLHGWTQGELTRGRSAMYFITPEAVDDLDLDVLDAGALAWFPDDLSTREHRRVVDAILGEGAAMARWYTAAPSTGTGWMVSGAPYEPDLPPLPLLHLAAVGVVLLLTLGVVAVGLALAAVESRDERDVLVAVGARPRTLRCMAGAKAVVMTLAGVLVAVPGGLLPAYAVTRAGDAPFDVPWLTLGGLVVVVPAVAGLASTVASGVAQRVRPVRMSTLAVD